MDEPVVRWRGSSEAIPPPLRLPPPPAQVTFLRGRRLHPCGCIDLATRPGWRRFVICPRHMGWDEIIVGGWR